MGWLIAKNLIPFLFVVVGLVQIRAYLRNLVQVHESESWPASQGTVMSSWVHGETIDADGLTFGKYYPEVRYLYRVFGSEYQGNKIMFGSQPAIQQSKAEATISNYPEGSSVMVYYDPNQPSNAVLERNVSKALLASGVMTVACGIFIFVIFVPV